MFDKKGDDYEIFGEFMVCFGLFHRDKPRYRLGTMIWFLPPADPSRLQASQLPQHMRI